MRKMLVLLAAAAAGACSTNPTPSPFDSSPNGIWRAQSGYTIQITGTEKYRFCGDDQCFDGKVEREGQTGLILKGFLDHPLTQKLQIDSGFKEANAHRSEMFRQEHDYDFSDNVANDDVRRERCAGRPCHVMGNQESGDFTFVKER